MRVALPAPVADRPAGVAAVAANRRPTVAATSIAAVVRVAAAAVPDGDRWAEVAEVSERREECRRQAEDIRSWWFSLLKLYVTYD